MVLSLLIIVFLAKELIKRFKKGNQKLLLIDYKFENGKSLSEDILNEISGYLSIERFSMKNRQDLIQLFEQYVGLEEFSAILQSIERFLEIFKKFSLG